MWHERIEAWEALQAHVGHRGQEVAENRTNTKEAELRIMELKGFRSPHLNCQSKLSLRAEKEVQNILVTWANAFVLYCELFWIEFSFISTKRLFADIRVEPE